MTVTEIEVRAPNSLVLVGDPMGEPPEVLAGALVSATSSCVAIGTLSDVDGVTKIRILDAITKDLPSYLAFEGEIDTPSNRLSVTSVLDETYLERHIAASTVSIKIWVNDREEPDEISIVVRSIA